MYNLIHDRQCASCKKIYDCQGKPKDTKCKDYQKRNEEEKSNQINDIDWYYEGNWVE